MNAIHVQEADGLKTSDLEVEIVERKGVGHPDPMCDAIMDGESRTLHLTVAMPLVDRMLHSEDHYFQRIEEIREAALAHLRARLERLDGLTLTLNALDRCGEGLSGIYASVLGVSAESADSGEVGRGNRVNGLISFCRPGGSEAAAGKNPVGHTGI